MLGDFDVTTLQSNTFEMEWPPRSCRRQSFPEIDRALWSAQRTRVFSERGRKWGLAGFDQPLRDAPYSGIFATPERAAGVTEQNLDPTSASPKKQKARALHYKNPRS
jgi:hypothetical protein